MIRAVMFDFDGTVIDTMNEYAGLASEIIEEIAGIDREKAKSLYLSTAGMSFKEQLKIMGIEGGKAEEIYRRFIEGKMVILKSKRISPHVEILIGNLKERGIISSLSTNNECSVVYLIDGIRAFDEVLCFNGSDSYKGEPHLKFLMEKYGLRKEEIVFIGDSDYDIRTYSVLGIKSIKTRGIFSEEERERIIREILEMG
ncbi:HAD hydrolase-like protein [Fervidicoccus fontis]|uniref:HAD hydrolase-like protein n=1 Tax=Fervidicoccus fontis TaxID=683846 RepID=A0A843AIR5_9CREN|nr:HAD hydrolase-like protein [Fervidicoccus fontis]MBE9390861.1 HAD hydrolase-like protein [Fervidicoccus fontis]